MNEEQFLSDLADILDVETELFMNTLLKDIEEWDSLSQVAFMSYVARYSSNKKISPQVIRNAEKISDLYNFVCE